MPHGHCVFWDEWLIKQWTISNLIIAFAYFAIPAMLIKHVLNYWKSNGWYLRCIVIMFANFIIACGLTHIMKVVEIWQPFYFIGLAFDWWCALASLATLAMIIGYKRS